MPLSTIFQLYRGDLIIDSDKNRILHGHKYFAVLNDK